MKEKSKSVRSQRSFSEHMKTLYQNIDTLVYAGMITCRDNSDNEYHCPLGKKCPFKRKKDFVGPSSCVLDNIRIMIGEHFEQSDIKTVELSQ